MERILWQTALEGALVLTAVTLAAGSLRGRSAAARHLAWALGMAGLVALPLLEAALPGWRLPLLPTAAEAAGWTPAGESPGGGDVDRKNSEPCDTGESDGSTPRPEPEARPVQVAVRAAGVRAH